MQPVGGEVEEPEGVALPAIAHFQDAGARRFVVLTQARQGALRYLDPARGWVDCSAAEFAGRRSGVLLLAEVPPAADFGAARAGQRAERLEALRVPLLLGLAGVALASPLGIDAPAVAPGFGPLWAMLARSSGPAAAQALQAWYADPLQGRARWRERHPLCCSPDPQAVERIFEAHCDGVGVVGLEGVPALLVDGRVLPREFSVDDLGMPPRRSG